MKYAVFLFSCVICYHIELIGHDIFSSQILIKAFKVFVDIIFLLCWSEIISRGWFDDK